jgi:hypothetical protein
MGLKTYLFKREIEKYFKFFKAFNDLINKQKLVVFIRTFKKHSQKN